MCANIPLVKASHMTKASLKEECGYRHHLLDGEEAFVAVFVTYTESQDGKHSGTHEIF